MSKTILTQVDGFTPLPDLLVTKYSIMTAAVWGKMWRYCQGRDGVCRAKLETLAKELNISKMSIIRHIETLVADGFMKDTTPDLKNRPHIYADTGKVAMYNKFGMSATLTESDSALTLSDSESHTELIEDSNNKIVNKDIIASANKKVDFILENERIAQEKLSSGAAWPGREKMPEPIRDLLDVYVKLTGQRPTKGNLMDWLSTGQDWLDLGINKIDLEKAYQKSKGEEGKGGFVVGRPGSLTNTANMFAGERRTGNNNNPQINWKGIEETKRMLDEKWGKDYGKPKQISEIVEGMTHDEPRT